MFNDLSISLQARGVRHIRVDVPDFSLWTYTKKKAPALEFTKTKALLQYLFTVSSYHSVIAVSIIIYCGISVCYFYEFWSILIIP